MCIRDRPNSVRVDGNGRFMEFVPIRDAGRYRVEVGASAGDDPLDFTNAADSSFDVRCLPNPHYELALRPLTGRDAPVITFLEAEPDVLNMRDDIARFIDTWLPCYIRDNRNYLTVGIGCTCLLYTSGLLSPGLLGYRRRALHEAADNG